MITPEEKQIYAVLYTDGSWMSRKALEAEASVKTDRLENIFNAMPEESDEEIAKRHYLKFLMDVGFGGYGLSKDEYLNYLDRGGK